MLRTIAQNGQTGDILNEFKQKGISPIEIVIYELEFLEKSKKRIVYEREEIVSIFQEVIPEEIMNKIIEQLLCWGKLGVISERVFYAHRIEDLEKENYYLWVKNRQNILKIALNK